MSLLGNYDRPGKGVLKTPHEKKGFFKFWEIYGRHMWKLMGLNIIYFGFLIPLFTMLILMFSTLNEIWMLLGIPAAILGPATAAMTRVVRNYSQERPTFMIHDFWVAFKKNFKQGIIMGFIDVACILWLIICLPIYQDAAAKNSVMNVPLVLSVAFAVMFLLMHIYIYQMICSTNLTMKQILKNSMFLVGLGFKNTMITFLVGIIVGGICFLFYPLSIYIMPIFPFTFVAFTACFNCYPVIRKFVIQPYYDKTGEQNPETAAYEVDPSEAIFVDKAAEEVPVIPEKKPKISGAKVKGKTIK